MRSLVCWRLYLVSWASLSSTSYNPTYELPFSSTRWHAWSSMASISGFFPLILPDPQCLQNPHPKLPSGGQVCWRTSPSQGAACVGPDAMPASIDEYLAPFHGSVCSETRPWGFIDDKINTRWVFDNRINCSLRSLIVLVQKRPAELISRRGFIGRPEARQKKCHLRSFPNCNRKYPVKALGEQIKENGGCPESKWENSFVVEAPLPLEA